MDVVTVGTATLLDLSTDTNQLVDSSQSIGPPYEGTNRKILNLSRLMSLPIIIFSKWTHSILPSRLSDRDDLWHL